MNKIGSPIVPIMPARDTGRGHVFWLFGFSGAGKSTLAMALASDLRIQRGENPLLLDGDRLRSGLCEGLGFSISDRSENLRRAAQVARLGVESDLIVVAAFITPLEQQRRTIQSVVGRDRISFVHVDAALEICRQRDVKGLYAREAEGNVRQMTGVSAEFEPPRQVGLRLSTAVESPIESAHRLFIFARSTLDQSSVLERIQA